MPKKKTLEQAVRSYKPDANGRVQIGDWVWNSEKCVARNRITRAQYNWTLEELIFEMDLY